MRNIIVHNVWNNASGGSVRNTFGKATANTKQYVALTDFTIKDSGISIKKGDILNLHLTKSRGHNYYTIIIPVDSHSWWTYFISAELGYVKEIVPAVSFAARTTLIA